MNSRIAVYGALKKGQARHAEFLLNSRWLGNCWVANYGMKDEGLFPIAFYAETFEINVEVYEVTDEVLTKIDLLENLKSGWYIRDKVDTPYGKAGMYTLRVTKMVDRHDHWYPDGIWLGQQTKKNPWLGWDKERDIRRRLIDDGMSERRRAFVSGPTQQHPVIGHSSNVALLDDESKRLEQALERSITVHREPDAAELRSRTRVQLGQFHAKMKVVEL